MYQNKENVEQFKLVEVKTRLTAGYWVPWYVEMLRLVNCKKLGMMHAQCPEQLSWVASRHTMGTCGLDIIPLLELSQMLLFLVTKK